MEFVHRTYLPGETIAAICTPPGEGGIAVIRISGMHAIDVAEKIFSGPVRKFQSHTVHFGNILDENGNSVDDVLLLLMISPRSYTGEDTVEIHCHGGSLITKKVLETVLKAGARAALPGEFTFRAFINGKMDLAQAEAVQELIGARNELALNAAGQQLQGTLSKHISSFQKELVDIAAILEAWVDFPEEDLEFASMEEVTEKLEHVRKHMQDLSSSFDNGKILHEGLSLCLAGSPNVGKSSLMNALLGKDRAIVTDIPGTTRDILEEEMRIGQLHFRLIDTAGIRETDETIEREGIRRTKQAMFRADLILLVMDAARGLNDEDRLLIASAPKEKTILVWNKVDLPHPPIPKFLEYDVHISAKEHLGIQDLCDLIDQVIWKHGPPTKEEVVITNHRHKQALSQAIEACDGVIQGLRQGISPEFVSSDMRTVLKELGTIIGTNITEDILSAIFSKFCIGK
ncbi:MAG TPA: tRNA uridine-5-carboxymethylaminomethyl(34) synthesis GTPase MnmE [Rhabdochlamydiaceae bacterium]|nr:tRNA uridine-5-carboxymethylaminomethyl(34) synthesis GTPase MnmE [Rhabdochlamydiaceae bacterium]